MQLWINGKSREFEEGLTVQELLDHLSLRPERLAVERNREIVPKAEYRSTQLKTDDRLELVSFVGGG